MGACDSQPQETTKSESKAQNELKNKINAEIVEIKNNFPYTEKLELQDENLFRRRKETINSKIQVLEDELALLQKELKKF